MSTLISSPTNQVNNSSWSSLVPVKFLVFSSNIENNGNEINVQHKVMYVDKAYYI